MRKRKPDAGSLARPIALIFGSALIDVIVSVAPEHIDQISMNDDSATYLLLEKGRKVPAQSISSHVGGGGCNTSVAMARLGWRARLHAKIGTDLNAAAVREHLQRNGVDSGLLVDSSDLATGVAVMIASHERNPAIFVHRGANEGLLASEIAGDAFDGANLVYVAPLSSGSADRFPEIVERARAEGAFIAANPGIRQLTSRTAPFFAALSDLDLLSLNAIEAATLAPELLARARGRQLPPSIELEVDATRLWRHGLRNGDLEMSLPAFFETVAALGPKFVLLTDGARGAYLGSSTGVLFCPALSVEPQSTAGAGDAMSATLAALIAEGASARDAIALATVNAASVVSFINTSDGLLEREALADRIHRQGLMLTDCVNRPGFFGDHFL